MKDFSANIAIRSTSGGAMRKLERLPCSSKKKNSRHDDSEYKSLALDSSISGILKYGSLSIIAVIFSVLNFYRGVILFKRVPSLLPNKECKSESSYTTESDANRPITLPLFIWSEKPLETNIYTFVH
jgi:hypothetical protein